jgi:hypothetical protein
MSGEIEMIDGWMAKGAFVSSISNRVSLRNGTARSIQSVDNIQKKHRARNGSGSHYDYRIMYC